MDTSKQTFTNTLLAWATVAPGVLIFFGIIRLYIYYQIFHVNIFEYISLSDALIAGLHYVVINIILYIALLIVFVLFFAEVLKNIPGMIETRSNQAEGKHEMKKKIKFSEWSRKDKAIWVLLNLIWWGFGLALILYHLLYDNTTFFIFGIHFYVAILIWWVIGRVNSKLNELNFGNKSKVYFNLYITVALAIFLVFCSVSTMTGFLYKYSNGSVPTAILYLDDNRQLELNSHLFEIGRTQEFTFLYNKDLKEVNILRNSDIKAVVNQLKTKQAPHRIREDNGRSTGSKDSSMQ